MSSHYSLQNYGYLEGQLNVMQQSEQPLLLLESPTETLLRQCWDAKEKEKIPPQEDDPTIL